ncbi:alpha/beta hydrolase [Alkalihalobacillus sp. 1P02AB]|uniref:alpha/beta hydrolase n=1 Tax=Alkalihalobacillus sp. 1P02AB TaxID=3132260 RepID=UPI0039A4846C
MHKNNNNVFSIAQTEKFMMYSEEKRDYQIFLHTPDTPAPEEGYPVLYLLDANAIFGSVVEALRMEEYTYARYEPAAVVGIGYPTDKPYDFERRFFDYTIHATNDESPEGMKLPEVGGADPFLQFIEQQLKPAIAQRIPVNHNRQAIFGHSLGGFFALHTLFHHPECFQTYIAGSPSLWWKNRYLLENLEDSCSKLSQQSQQKNLYLAIGSEELSFMVEDAATMYDRLASKNLPCLNIDYKLFEGEGHISIFHPLIRRALDFFLRKKDR